MERREKERKRGREREREEGREREREEGREGKKERRNCYHQQAMGYMILNVLFSQCQGSTAFKVIFKILSTTCYGHSIYQTFPFYQQTIRDQN